MKFSTIILAFVTTVVCNPIVARQTTPLQDATTAVNDVASTLPGFISAISGGVFTGVGAATTEVEDLSSAITSAATDLAGTQITAAQQAALLSAITSDITTTATLVTTTLGGIITAASTFPPNVNAILALTQLAAATATGLVLSLPALALTVTGLNIIPA